MVIKKVRLENVFFIALIVILSIILGYLIFNKLQKKPTESPTPIPTPAAIEVVAKNLEVPWALAFLPDNTILVTERAGRVKLVDQGGNQKEVGKIDVKQIGEGGLHGIAVDPDFKTNHYIYLYYTYGQSGNQTLNRVTRLKLEQVGVTGETVIIDQIAGAMFHDGGRLKFGPDKFLYITTGDAQQPSLSQNPNSLAGKILRVKDPSTSSGQVEVYSLGHRNPQGITWDDQGRLWETEHGSQATDEVNLIEQGKNYGWPIIRGDQTQAGLESPILQSGSDTWAPAGAAFYEGSIIRPEEELQSPSIYFGGLKGQALYQVKLDSLELKEHFKGQFGRIRDVVLGPDNMLYITTSNRDGRGSPTEGDDRIIRINPQLL